MMYSNYFTPLFSLLIVSSASAVDYDCTLPPGNMLRDGLTVAGIIHPVNLTVTMQMVWQGQGWLGLGRSDEASMIGGEAVIGLPELPQGLYNPAKYHMEAEKAAGVFVQEKDKQTLIDASIMQNDEYTILTYTKYIEEDSEFGVPIDVPSTWIYAVGNSNVFPAEHARDGAFTMQFNLCKQIAETPSPTPVPVTPSPTAAPKTPSPTVTAPVDEIFTEPAAEEEAEPAEEDKPAPEPVKAPAAEPVVEDKPTTEESTAEEEPTTTEKEPVTEEAEPSTLTSSQGQASGSTDTAGSSPAAVSAAQAGSFAIIKSSVSGNKGKWIAHAVCMCLAWGFFVPVAIAVSILRDTLGLSQGMWFKIHRSFNGMAFILTVIGVMIAISAMSKQDGNHFTDSTHTKVGLVVFLFMILQVTVAIFRPKAIATTHSSNTNAAKSIAQNSDEEKSLPNNSPKIRDSDEEEEVNVTMSEKSAEIANSSFNDNDDDFNLPIPLMRLLWEYKHRLVGVLLLSMAWYNCHAGFGELALLYGEDYDKSNAFWGVAGFISGTVILIQYVLQW